MHFALCMDAFYAIKTAFTYSNSVFVWSWPNGNGVRATK
jgi:hypothetical protein